MLDKGRISSVQLLLLLIIADAATAFLYGPAASIQLAGRDSWLSVSALASVSGLAVALVSIGLARRFPQQVFTEYLPQILGGIPGKILAGIYAAVFIHYTAVVSGYLISSDLLIKPECSTENSALISMST